MSPTRELPVAAPVPVAGVTVALRPDAVFAFSAGAAVVPALGAALFDPLAGGASACVEPPPTTEYPCANAPSGARTMAVVRTDAMRRMEELQHAPPMPRKQVAGRGQSRVTLATT